MKNEVPRQRVTVGVLQSSGHGVTEFMVYLGLVTFWSALIWPRSTSANCLSAVFLCSSVASASRKVGSSKSVAMGPMLGSPAFARSITSSKASPELSGTQHRSRKHRKRIICLLSAVYCLLSDFTFVCCLTGGMQVSP